MRSTAHRLGMTAKPFWPLGLRTISMLVRRIRAALEEKSSYEYIHTARGLGYRFEPGA